jgi:hypothetical protein
MRLFGYWRVTLKRDMELIRSLLLAIEESPNDYTLDNYDGGVVRYHEALLVEKGLVEGAISKELGGIEPPFVRIFKLTWDGHEFIDNLRDESVWNSIKSDFKEASFSTIVKVSKDLAEGFAKKKVEAILS